MHISQIEVDNTLNSARRALSSPQVMHAIIENCFETPERNLWRLDGNKLLVVSNSTPTNPNAARQLGSATLVTKNYKPFLSSIKANNLYHFRLTANPVHSVKTAPGKRGKVLAHVTPEQQMDWLHSKADKLGVIFEEMYVNSSKFIRFKRNGSEVTLKLATYDGFLVVKNSNSLTDAMVCGIGRAKAYGAGLLTLMQ